MSRDNNLINRSSQNRFQGPLCSDFRFLAFIPMLSLLLAAPAQAARVTLPAAPSSLSATAPSSTQINVTWVDNSSNETGFIIQRAPASTGPWSQIGTVGAGLISYSDPALSAGTTYYYRVCAYNSKGNSSFSNVTSASTPCNFSISPSSAAPASGATSGSVTLSSSGSICN